ncbi:DUF6125 family protein [Nocardia sp. R6R-6]|uniref:DUF6125 family protein n=1 Tax=Nocardia sp. R6R-6 TaxID=3459303 RepID=UPI00403D62A2
MTKELDDLSGPFDPDFKPEDLSKEALLKLWRSTCRLLIGIDGHWATRVREKLGEEATFEINNGVWEDMVAREKRWITDGMNMTGNDLATFFKFQQVNPATAGIMEIELDLESANKGTMTVTRCSVLESCEKLGMPERQKACCDMDVIYFPNQAREINPNIETKCLKLPPRQSKDEIACKWEFTLEPQTDSPGL